MTTTTLVALEEPEPTTAPPPPTSEQPVSATTTTSESAATTTTSESAATTTTARQAEWTVDLPFYDPSGGGSAQSHPVSATLVGDPDVDGGCVWLDFGGGPETIEWVPGTKARFFTREDGTGTFELIDPYSGVVAAEGDTVTVDTPRTRSGRAERCNVGDGDTHVEVPYFPAR